VSVFTVQVAVGAGVTEVGELLGGGGWDKRCRGVQVVCASVGCGV